MDEEKLSKARYLRSEGDSIEDQRNMRLVTKAENIRKRSRFALGDWLLLPTELRALTARFVTKAQVSVPKGDDE